MENLFNMFSSDYIGEETDEILTDDLAEQYRLPAEDDAEVKNEPEESQEEDENAEGDDDLSAPDKSGKRKLSATDDLLEVPEDNDSSRPSSVRASAMDDNDDDAIFNFGLEPQVSITEEPIVSATPSAQPVYKSVDFMVDDYNMPINYETAVVYICPACGAEFNAQDAWKRHINGVHNYNTRRGLNFVQIDKLYHECMECHKRIAMHAMENLLKHKFTHLPYRCTKCKICLRQYKYRQDLMVHLRMTHRDDVIAMNKTSFGSGKKDNGGGRSLAPAARLEIKDIKENAIDIFENTFEDIEVKNELIEPDDNDEHSNSQIPSFLEDSISHSSSERQGGLDLGGNGDDELYEKNIQYICPQCATEYGTQSQWRQHIEQVHDFGTRKGLNFKEVNMNQHAQCLECKKVLYLNVIRVLQLHKFSHLTHKSWLRCKLCYRSFLNHKDIVRHMQKQHPDPEFNDIDDSQDASRADDGGDPDGDEDTANLLSEQASRDTYEVDIDYLCPQCGIEFQDKRMWRKHIVGAHHLTDLTVLNFKVINERQVQCNECAKVITNAYGVQNAQQHRITHMPYKAFIRCRLCAKSYTDRKGLVKHLRAKHRSSRHLSDFSQRAVSSTPVSAANAQPLLSQALRGGSFSSVRPKLKPSLRQKEIVRHANYTFEIQYLDEEDDDEIIDFGSTTFGSGGNGHRKPDTAAPPPAVSFTNSFANFAQTKCADCGSIFPTQRALQLHMRAEHEFQQDYGDNDETPKKVATEQLDKSSMHVADEQSSDNEELLLVPTGDEDVSYASSSSQGGASSIERNFCYLCPACGLEYKQQLDWRRHINEAHNFDKRQYLNFRPIDRFRFQCTICEDVVASAKLKGLQDHKFRHLPFKLYIKCLLCSTCYNHKPNMISHLRMRHNLVDTRTPSECGDFDFNVKPSFQRPTASPRPIAIMSAKSNSSGVVKPPGLKTVEDCISFHNAVDHNSITYFCPQCNENFDTHVFWRKHIVDEHNLNSREGLNFRQIDEHHYLCLQCYKRVTVTHTKGAIGQLQSHKFRHLPYKSFKCLACNGEFVRKQMFFKHLNRATNRCESRPSNDCEQNDDDHVMTMHDILAADEERSQRTPYGGDALVLDQNCFTLICPQCGKQFDSWRPWREHINIEHSLGRRDMLNFKKLSNTLHECLECKERVSGNKLRDLQIHKFKHLSHGSFIQCRFCPTSNQYIRHMKNHMQQKHPNVLQKPEYGKMDDGEEPDASVVLSDGEADNNSNSNDAAMRPRSEPDDDEQFLLG